MRAIVLKRLWWFYRACRAWECAERVKNKWKNSKMVENGWKWVFGGKTGASARTWAAASAVGCGVTAGDSIVRPVAWKWVKQVKTKEKSRKWLKKGGWGQKWAVWLENGRVRKLWGVGWLQGVDNASKMSEKGEKSVKKSKIGEDGWENRYGGSEMSVRDQKWVVGDASLLPVVGMSSSWKERWIWCI